MYPFFCSSMSQESYHLLWLCSRGDNKENLFWDHRVETSILSHTRDDRWRADSRIGWTLPFRWWMHIRNIKRRPNCLIVPLELQRVDEFWWNCHNMKCFFIKKFIIIIEWSIYWKLNPHTHTLLVYNLYSWQYYITGERLKRLAAPISLFFLISACNCKVNIKIIPW